MTLWLLTHGCLLTNELKWRRKLHSCSSYVESCMHVMRDCMDAKKLWLRALEGQRRFFTLDLMDWVSWNLGSIGTFQNLKWREFFVVVCWLLWGRRNQRVFEAKHDNNDVLLSRAVAILACFEKTSVKDVVRSLNGQGTGVAFGSKAEMSGSAPVYVDGACSLKARVAGCGGYITDEYSNVKEAFVLQLPSGNPLRAELWGCLMGLKRAWDIDIRRAVLLCDSSEAISLALGEEVDLHEDRDIISEIKSLLD